MELKPNIPESAVPINYPVPKPTAFAQGMNPGYQHEVADRGVDLNRFFGRPDPNEKQVRKFEQPWHRAAAYHWASGKMSMKDISIACDVCYASVQALCRNPWFQETVNEIMKQNGAKDVMDLFKAEQFNSLVTLVELRDNQKMPAAVRRASAVDILDRYLGKPVQRVETAEVLKSEDPVAEVKRLEEENKRLRHAEAELSSEAQRVSHGSDNSASFAN